MQDCLCTFLITVVRYTAPGTVICDLCAFTWENASPSHIAPPRPRYCSLLIGCPRPKYFQLCGDLFDNVPLLVQVLTQLPQQVPARPHHGRIRRQRQLAMQLRQPPSMPLQPQMPYATTPGLPAMPSTGKQAPPRRVHQRRELAPIR